MRRRSPFVFVVLALVGSVSFIALDRTVAPQHLPWRPLDPNAPLGFSTKTQLMRVSLSPSKLCREKAQAAETLNSIDADPYDGKGRCGWDKARIVFETTDIMLKPGETTMQCPLALGTHIWIQETQRLAADILGSPVQSVQHAGSYACRNQVGNNSGRISEHSFANAWDVTGFTLQDGRVVSVKSGWNTDGPEREFLRKARSAGCKIFRVTLSPDYNQAHADHFHFDMGPNAICS